MPIKDQEKLKAARQRYDAKRAGSRTRNWTFFVYPSKEYLDSRGSTYDGSDGYGSAPENWRDIIDEEHIEWVESPLHENDINPDDGRTKKPHWHILVLYESVKTYEQIKELTDKLNSPIPQKANGVKGLVRYMAHLDHPDKAQYKISDIIGHGGVDLASLLRPSSSERYQLIAEMIVFVRDKGIMEMEDLLVYAMSERFDDWFPLLCDNSAYIMGKLLNSRRHRVYEPQPLQKHKIDPETGEIE